ncbi:MAG: hypothetical protein ABI607_09855 [Betaproteobacteria bacterium]
MESSQTLSPFEIESTRPLSGAPASAGASSRHAASPNNVIDAQKQICVSIALLIRDSPPERSHLDAFMVLERQAQQVGNRLLTQYVEGDAQIRLMQWTAWQSAYHLSRWLIQACQHFLPQIRTLAEEQWFELEHGLLVKLFHHRKVEFLLRFLRYKRRSDDQWRQLHVQYRSARERDLRNTLEEMQQTEVGRDVVRRRAGPLEQQYLQILLLEAMNCGRFSPREALWAHRWFARWCSGSELQLEHCDGSAADAHKGFVVDLSGSEGLSRGPATGPDFIHFDSSPLRALIEGEMTSLGDVAALPLPVTPAVRAGQLALLRKLRILFAPHAMEIARRTERHPVAMAVQTIAGFSGIVEALRKSGLRNYGSAAMSLPAGSVGTDASISEAPSLLITPADAEEGQADSALHDESDDIAQNWQVKDRSDSGCRMRGQIGDMNRVIPGSLIAIRDDSTSPWTVAVVRWFRRLMVDHVEIGVEYLGRSPRFVKMVAGGRMDFAVDEILDSSSRCFAALYLPPSDGHPTMPIKTLLLPAGEFKAGGEVMLLSSTATYRMRLNEPIQQQYEFVLTSFGVIGQPAPLAAAMQ